MPNYSDTRVNDMIFNVLDSARYNTLLANNQLNNNQLYFIIDDAGSITFTQNNSTLATYTGNNNITIDLTTMPQAVADSNGNNILATYANALTASGTTLTLKAKNGDTLSTVTTQDTKNTAGSTNSTSKLYLIGATGQSANPQTYSNSKVYVTDGTLTATTFSGNLSGNASTATLAAKATGDANGNPILSSYASSLSLSGNTLTLKSKNDDTLSTVTIATSDTKVNVTLGTTSKAYLLATTSTPTATAAGVTSIADTGVYLGTTAGELVATKFTGDLAGNAATATLATKATGDANGNSILSNYASSLESSGNSLILKAKNGDTLSTVTVAASDTKVNVTLGTTSKAYILATTTTPTSTAAGVTSIADTGVYLGTTAGELVATKFTGDLNGNAATATSATKATGDANGNAILSNYASSLSASGTTLTLKAKNGDTLSTVTTQDTKNTAGSTNSTSKLFLIGATSQAANPQTYSSSKVYVTDGTITATTFSGNATSATTAVTADKATGDASGNAILSNYASSLESSGSSLVLKAKNGDTLSTVTVAASDTKVNVKARGTTKAYVLGTTTSPTSSDQAVTSVAETGVYFDTTAAKLVATTFKGALEGNASTATLATKATGDGNGNEIISKYASELTANGNTLTLKAKNGDTLSTVNLTDNDVKVNVKARGTTKAYILGTTTSPTSSNQAVESVAETGVYFDTSAAKVVATTFKGALEGNASTATLATKATGDGSGNEIISKYASSLSASGTTLTLKAKNGDTLSTVTTQDTKNTAGSTNSTSKLFLIGATSQGANPQTYSSSKVYVTDGTVTATTFSGALSGNASTATLADKATGDGSGNEIISHYASELTVSGTTLTLKAKNGDTLSQVTTQDNDTKNTAGSTNDTSKLFIIGAKSQGANPQTYSSSKVYITDGTITATTFSGNATSATSATSATNDSSGHKIVDWYVHGISSSNNTLTLISGDEDNLTHNTATANIINSVSNTWADGTTSGPTIKTTVNGVAGTAVAIPSASKTTSGVITTGSQSFKGRKGFGYISLYAYDDSANAVQWAGDFMYYNNAGTKVAETWYDIGNATNITKGQYFWRQWSPQSTADTTVTSYYETYSLPNVASGLTENKSYSILTTKNTVTVAQGGTGATTFTANAVLYGNGTSAIQAKASASGALYATATNGALSFGTLPVAQGGTGTTSFTANSVVISGSTTTAALTTRAITNNTSNTAIATGTNIPTMNTIYYGLAVINNASQNRGVSIYAPTSAGTANQILVSAGGTSAPTWKATANGAAYATSANGALTFGTLPIAQGGTGLTSSPSMLTNLGSTTAANVLQASPRPGITGTLGTANGGTGQTSWTANKLVYASAATCLSSTGGLSYFTGNSTASTPATYTRLHINGSTYGNTAANMISGTAGLFSFGDGGPQITFDTNATPGGSQAGALIFTDHDTAGTGASWHFVSNQSDWTVTSKRFHARTSISIGTDLPVTSDALYINGTTLTTNNISRTAASLGTSWIGSRDKAVINVDASDSTSSTAFSLARIKFSTKTYAIGSERAGNAFGIYGWNNSRTENGTDWAFYIGNDTYFRCTTRLYGAVWNDYAEYRISKEKEPGRCVREVGDDTLVLTTERLQLGCEIVSDTFGFAIGQTEKADTPIASNGRVLAYPLEDREEFKNHIGEPVCSGPNGTVSIMTKEEIKEYPHCIIGTISAVPDYEEWGTENIKVNGRIWIRVR